MIGEIEQALEALNRAEARYLVVGGVAVGARGGKDDRETNGLE